MKDINKQKGIITIEVSISFVIFMFLILFIYSYSNVYIAQNLISHATIQANQTIALESYGRKKLSDTKLNQDIQSIIGDINSMGNTLFGIQGGNPFNDFKSLDDVDLEQVYKKAWKQAISNQTILNSQSNYADKLSSVGVDTNKIKFDVSLENSTDGGTDIVTIITYDVKLQFPFLGKEKLESVTKQSKSRLFENVNNKRNVSWKGID